MLKRIVITGLFMLSLGQSAPAFAQSDSKAAARVHFQKGVTAFNERRYSDAADEFDTAYRLSPAFVVLYNIGQVNVALGNPVEAVKAFDEYLEQGAASVSRERREEVQAEIEEQRAHIGALKIASRPEQAEVRVDGKLIGTTPLPEPFRVKAGHHTVEAMLAPHQPELREVEVPGQSTLDIEFSFDEVSATPAAAPVAPQPPAPVVVRVESVPEPATVRTEVVPVERVRSGPSINWLRVTGYVVAAGGVVVGTIGGIYALEGANKASDARARMAAATTPEEYDAAVPDYELGKARNQRGWIIAACGGAGVIAGLLLVVAAPDRNGTAQLTPWLGLHTAGLELNRSF